MIKNVNIFFLNIFYVLRLEPTIPILTAIRSIHRAKRDSNGYRIRKYITLKSILLMFANLIFSRRYTSFIPVYTAYSWVPDGFCEKTLGEKK